MCEYFFDPRLLNEFSWSGQMKNVGARKRQFNNTKFCSYMIASCIQYGRITAALEPEFQTQIKNYLTGLGRAIQKKDSDYVPVEKRDLSEEQVEHRRAREQMRMPSYQDKILQRKSRSPSESPNRRLINAAACFRGSQSPQLLSPQYSHRQPVSQSQNYSQSYSPQQQGQQQYYPYTSSPPIRQRSPQFHTTPPVWNPRSTINNKPQITHRYGLVGNKGINGSQKIIVGNQKQLQPPTNKPKSKLKTLQDVFEDSSGSDSEGQEEFSQ